MAEPSQPGVEALGLDGVRPPVPVEVRRHRLVGEVARRLRRRCGVAPGARVVIGISGGADSVALLLTVAALHQRRRNGRTALDPIAVHVHHHLRDDADDDASFVAGLCGRLGVELRTEHVYPQDMSGNVAANARDLRYLALSDTAVSLGAGHVAVAHHAEDQFETMLIALCRGAGLDGLSGMPWSRPLADGVTLIRPLLATHRSACEDLCRTAGVQWCEDPTNADRTTARGRLRCDVLPVLESLWPDVASRVANTADVVATARAALQHHVRAAFGDPSQHRWDRSHLAELPVPIIAAGLRRAVLAAAPQAADDLGQSHLLPVAEAIRSTERRPRRFHWPHSAVVVVTSKSVHLDHVDREPRGTQDSHGPQR